MSAEAKKTFARLQRSSTGRADPGGQGIWQQYGPQKTALQPGVLAFSGATNTTASRMTAMRDRADLQAGHCRLWVGVSGGGVWRTDDALAAEPRVDVAERLRSRRTRSATLTADPNDPSGNTLYLGTGEANRCSSGCEAGVGIYKSTNGGDSWTKLADTCVSNATYACVTPGQDSFLGRGINSIVVDPTNANHIFVGSALGVRGLSHVIGNGGTTRLEPGANVPGRLRVDQRRHDVHRGLERQRREPRSASPTSGSTRSTRTTVYASAFDQGLWRRSPALDGSSSPYDFRQVFAPRFPGGGTDRTMFAPTVKNGTTRLYLTDGTANGGGILAPTAASSGGRTTPTSRPRRCSPREAAGHDRAGRQRQPVPGDLQRLAEADLAARPSSPYFATDDFCTGQCWYD